MRRFEGRAALTILFTVLALTLVLAALPALAQEQPVTDDDVNAIAKRLYCPVCENIPLDVCDTPACIQWRADIRDQLEEGMPPQAIVDGFVRRFGERVVGTPQDPMLAALSLITPWVIALVALYFGLQLLRRWRSGNAPATATVAAGGQHDEASYRSRLEADLKARR